MINKNDNILNVLYIHIPFCPTGCKFCHFYLDGGKKTGYIDLLRKEYNIRFGEKKIKAKCIHIGGGTPNMLSLQEMGELLDFLNEKIYGFEEFSIELHPALLSFEYLDLLKAKGINRISFGIQSLDEDILKKHTRVDINYEDLGKYIDYSRKIGFEKINFDFIYDLIGDSLLNIKKNLEFINKYKPTSVYYYKLRKFTDFLKNKHKSTQKKAFSYYLFIKQFFKNSGFYRLNNSVYFNMNKLKGAPPFLYDEIIYSKKHNLIGLGVCATSNIGNRYFKNSINYELYKKNILSNIDAIDLDFTLESDIYFLNKFYFYILQNHTFNLNDFLYEFSFELLEKNNLFIKKLIKFDFINFNNNIISLTEKGHYYIDEKLGDIIFSGYKEEYELLKKL